MKSRLPGPYSRLIPDGFPSKVATTLNSELTGSSPEIILPRSVLKCNKPK
jgi:hypothetical protein